MFGFGKSKTKDENKPSRKFQRREAPMATALVNGFTLQVKNWSFGGVLLATPSGGFAIGQVVHLALDFRIGDRKLDTQQSGEVTRSEGGITAIAFGEPSPGFLRCLQQVADYTAAAAR